MDATQYEAHEKLETNHWWFDARREIIRETLGRALPRREGLKLLDVGCGTGGMAPMLASFGEVEGVEGSPDARNTTRSLDGSSRGPPPLAATSARKAAALALRAASAEMGAMSATNAS